MENNVKVQPEIHYRMSDSVVKIAEALIKASKKIKHAEKDAQNSHFNNSYATLEATIDASKDILLEEGIVVIQFPGKKILTTRLQHCSGEFYECDLELQYAKQDMQGYGSALTYGRRQSLSTMLNMAQKDDDGNKASQEGKNKPSKTVIKNKADKSDDPFAG